MNTLMLVLSVGLFGVGFAGIPIACYVFRGGLPAALSEPLASALLSVGLFGAGKRTRLIQTAEDAYEIVPESELYTGEPVADGGSMTEKRVAFGGTKLALSFEPEPEAWGDAAYDVDVEAMEPNKALTKARSDGTEVAEVDIERNGFKSFVELVDPDAVRVAIGQQVSTLYQVAGIGLVNRAQRVGMERHGGDDSASQSRKWIFMERAFMTVMGAGTAWVVLA